MCSARALWVLTYLPKNKIKTKQQQCNSILYIYMVKWLNSCTFSKNFLNMLFLVEWYRIRNFSLFEWCDV